MSEIDNLLNSLMQAPGMRVMHFAKDDTICKNIQNFCKGSDFDSEYLILTFSQDDEERLKYLEDDITKVKYVNENRAKFNIQAKLYDYLFITNLPNETQSFFKRVYSALKNGAPIFIFLDKNDRELAYKLESELIESNYVASNKMQIDNFLVLSSKKMHGWSGA